jgi:hypothetical protein
VANEKRNSPTVSPSPPSHPASLPIPAGSARTSRAQRPHGPRGSSTAAGPPSRAIEDLLHDLGPQLRRGGAPARDAAPSRLSTGLPEIDRLIGGGFATGSLGEITGPPSSGRTSLALALLAHTTRRGEVVAWVDPTQAFDPASAQAAGASLAQVLWARPPGPREAVRCCACLLSASGFALVVLDLGCREAGLPSSTWQRLARAAAGTDTALVVLSPGRTTGSHCDLALELRAPRPLFAGTPALLEEVEIEAVVTRQRRGPVRSTASVHLRAASCAA